MYTYYIILPIFMTYVVNVWSGAFCEETIHYLSGKSHCGYKFCPNTFLACILYVCFFINVFASVGKLVKRICFLCTVICHVL
jgi:hypothetical protein